MTFKSAKRPEHSEESKEIPLETLCGFFKNPPRYFLRHVLQIYPPRETSVLTSDEPFALSDFADDRLREAIHSVSNDVGDGGRDDGMDDARGRAMADAILPYGNIGRSFVQQGGG